MWLSPNEILLNSDNMRLHSRDSGLYSLPCGGEKSGNYIFQHDLVSASLQDWGRVNIFGNQADCGLAVIRIDIIFLFLAYRQKDGCNLGL